MKTLKAKMKSPRTTAGKKFNIDLKDWVLEDISIKSLSKLDTVMNAIRDEVEAKIENVVYKNTILALKDTLFKKDMNCVDMEFVIRKGKLFLKLNIFGMVEGFASSDEIYSLLDPYEFFTMYDHEEGVKEDPKQGEYYKKLAKELHKFADAVEVLSTGVNPCAKE